MTFRRNMLLLSLGSKPRTVIKQMLVTRIIDSEMMVTDFRKMCSICYVPFIFLVFKTAELGLQDVEV
jgi:hypothetical protein